MASIFSKIYTYFRKRKVLFYLLMLCSLAAVGLLAKQIRFEEDISKLIPGSAGSDKISEVLKTVKFADKIVVNIRSNTAGNAAILKQYADEFTTLTKKNASPYIHDIQSRIADEKVSVLLDFVADHIPFYLDKRDYQQLDAMMQPAALTVKIQDSYRTLLTPGGVISASFLRSDPFGMAFMGLEKFKKLQAGGNYTMDDGYIMSQNQQNLFVFIGTAANANETDKNTKLIHILDDIISHLNDKYKPVIQAEYFGPTAVAVSNAQQVKQDIQLTLSIAFVLLISLFIYFYRKIHIPIIILVPAAFGSLLGIGVLFLIKGTISAVSIGVGSVLLGLTLDYSLHILSHYRSAPDIQLLFKSITKPLLICAIFTGVDFLCLLFLHSDVLHDLGIFAAISVMGSALFALVFVPQVYSPHKTITVRQDTFVDKLAAYDYSRNKWLLGGCLAVTVLSLFTYQHVGFDNDLAALNYETSALKQAEKRLDSLNNYASKSIYLVVYGDTYAEALEKNDRLDQQLQKTINKKDIADISSIGGLVLPVSQQQEKIRQWQAFWTPQKKEQLRQALIREGSKVHFRENTFAPFFQKLSQSVPLLQPGDYAPLQALFLDNFVSTRKGLTSISSLVRTSNEKADTLVNRLSAENPDILVIDRKHLQEKFISNLETDFNNLFLISSAAVFVVLFLFFGSLELTLITNIPIFLGWFITLGLMGAFGISFNAFNIIITTLIFGLGVDYSIFITKGLLEQYTYGKTDMPAYKAGILMSAITTIGCFGVLVLAKHPAIRSIALIPLIGLFTVVLMSFSVQPWLFRVFIMNPQNKGNTPWRIFNLLLTALTFGYFFIGTFLLDKLAQLLIPVLPMDRKKKFRIFHKTVQIFFRILIFRTPFIRIKRINWDPGVFVRPIIVIANHTSILDTPTMGMLHARLIFMVNKRVLHSAFFGKAIQMAGFHSTSQPLEESPDSLREKIKQGYSLIVFPEGTRSETATMGRLHKGAFYLAEQLKLDILPVLIHGNTDLLPKNDNMLKTGKMTIEFLPLIAHNDPQYGSTYVLRAKNISRYFKASFRRLRQAEEDPDYFKHKVYFNYVYKASAIQKAVKRTFQQQKAVYKKLTDFLPEAAQILHVGCDYGVLDFLLAYGSSKRRIVATDEDADKVNAARQTYAVQRYPIHFTQQLPAGGHPDVLILSKTWKQDLTAYFQSAHILVLEGDEAKNFHKFDASNHQVVFQEGTISIYQKHAGI